MIIDRNKLCYLLMIVIVLLTTFALANDGVNNYHLPNITKDMNGDHDSGQPEARSFFSPRIDYNNEWMPVGRGDPLKNDPTYDYSPPVLDRVRYWGDTNKDKKEILLLGVPSKRQNHKKETTHNNTYAIRRNYYPSSHSSLHHLPTRLMPPPVQTIQPTIKQTSTESYYNLYSQSSNYNNPSYNWNMNSVHNYDTYSDESINFVSLTQPEINSNSKPSISNSNYGQYYTTGSRKPWIYELLQKEITKPAYSSPSVVQTSTSISPQTSSPSLSTSSNYFLTPSKNIYESHSSLEPISFTYVTPSLTTEEPVEQTYFQPTIPPTPATSTYDSYTSASYKKKNHHYHEINSIHGPMYLIIQGHSKVKTYGLKDNDTNDHTPKIVPVAPKEEAITKHVVSKDDNGKIFEIKHLYKKAPAIEQLLKDKSEINNLTITTIKPMNMQNITNNTTTSTTPSTTTTTEESSPMKSLLSLLDSSLGNFFINNFEEENNENKTEMNTTKKPLNTPTPKINKNCTTTTTENNEIRERRQIFDYDQLPESSVFEGFDDYYEDDGDEDDDDATIRKFKSELREHA